MMSSRTERETTTTNADGMVERRVETTDFRSSAGQGQEQRDVQVIHEPKIDSKTSGGTLAGAAAAAATALQSAQNAISGK
ncbi:hypothetical protein HS088_TW01G00790 [Tripterygium wilfordii]|uniref:Uncharacterized protein n=1 Tax=Tripterygium wilfordii TaxID=458696 RepID=A0A7J7E2I1_TRIWF|nr:uncharacterized protein LOC119985124 [Tripterygium wilfordii]KAF5752872.1 hypothetical protein HS088_TW01G00790 [Tripterygium wilfordii]